MTTLALESGTVELAVPEEFFLVEKEDYGKYVSSGTSVPVCAWRNEKTDTLFSVFCTGTELKPDNVEQRIASYIQSSMEKQMKAERDRRQAILQAEGQKHSAILVAEGQKESAILQASAEKEAAILRAEAAKQAAILKAEGEAQAILAIQQATADALKMLNEASPNDQVIKLKALEAMQKVADGQATKLIIPSDMQGLAALAGGLKEVVRQ